MTTTTATAKALTIPPAGLTHEANGTVVTAKYSNGAGYKVEVRTNGAYDASKSSLHTFEDGRDGALSAFYARCDEADANEPAEVETPAAPVAAVEPISGNHGGTLRVSDPSHTVLAVAAFAEDGIVKQGGGLGRATDSQIRGLAKNGYLEIIPKKGGTPYSVGAGRITAKGLRRLAELTAADAHNARVEDAINRYAA